ncbi:hypothetical protein A0H81_09342 [Grifola frondosa]|uniref:Uncharacterized protein n=1 Tax=Grifola frondosa TaxID=5627 RepID=A0A1C7M7B6_GRIFR|nr:hypothetical protein A0H81_09342 [Grifola frondosa]
MALTDYQRKTNLLSDVLLWAGVQNPEPGFISGHEWTEFGSQKPATTRLGRVGGRAGETHQNPGPEPWSYHPRASGPFPHHQMFAKNSFHRKDGPNEYFIRTPAIAVIRGIRKPPTEVFQSSPLW